MLYISLHHIQIVRNQFYLKCSLQFLFVFLHTVCITTLIPKFVFDLEVKVFFPNTTVAVINGKKWQIEQEDGPVEVNFHQYHDNREDLVNFGGLY